MTPNTQTARPNTPATLSALNAAVLAAAQAIQLHKELSPGVRTAAVKAAEEAYVVASQRRDEREAQLARMARPQRFAPLGRRQFAH